MDLISHLAKTKASFIHPLGEKGTDLLIKQIPFKDNLKVLEVGCGTGATGEKILSSYKLEYYAVDQSFEMIKKAKKRNNIKAENIIQIKENKLPFDDNVFDIVFAESVLAIIEGEYLEVMVNEIYRVLKPKGVFASNDSIWKAGTNKENIEIVNNYCKINFNLIQANQKWCFKSEWIELFEEVGFKEIISQKLTPTTNRSSKRNWSKLTTLVLPTNLINEYIYKKYNHKIYEYGKYIEAYIFKMKK